MTSVMEKSSRGSSARSGSWSAIAPRVSLNGALGVSLIALLLCAVFVLVGVSTLVTTAFAGGTGKARAAAELDKLVAQHKTEMQTWQDRINGRSVFFKPQKPYVPPPPPPIDTSPKPPPTPPPPPGPPARYEGPAIAFAAGDTVYFNPVSNVEKYMSIRVGEEKSGVKVVSCNLPWSVKLGYKGGEYDVPIFSKDIQDALVSNSPKPADKSPFLINVLSPEPHPTTTDAHASSPDPVTVQATTAVRPGERPGSLPSGPVHAPRSRAEKPLPPARGPQVHPTQDGPEEQVVTEQAGEDEPVDEGDPSPPATEPAPPSDPDLSPTPHPHY